MPDHLVPRAHLGVLVPASPTRDPADVGRATLTAPDDLVVRGWATVIVDVTAGLHGVDDGGTIQIALRFPWDGGALQATDPAAPNYVTAVASSGAKLELSWTARAPRPFFKALVARVYDGFLRPGDTVRFVLGDRAGGSPGLRLQTFAEDHLELRVLIDPIATGYPLPVVDVLTFAVRPGPPARLRVITPTLRRPDEPFAVGIVAEDAHGNPTAAGEPVALRVEGLAGAPATVAWPAGARAVRVEGVVGPEVGVARVHARCGSLAATSGPILIERADRATYWADFHGQTAETVGVNTADRYFEFARDLSMLDICGHQANDFQITDAFWAHLDALTTKMDEPGRFVALPGWEWSGNTGVGGDRNVLLRHQGRPIRRSSRALIVDASHPETDAPTANALFEGLAGEDAVVFAHVGGRWADLSVGHDGRVERAVEVHSAWGTFLWLLEDALRLGHRVGVVANSDGHKGRPGASYPGASMFGALGGLTCVRADRLDRDAVFAAVRARRTYGTSGARVHVDLTASFPSPVRVWSDDPALGPATSTVSDRASMGDVVTTECDYADVTVRAAAGCAIERVEVIAGSHREVLHVGAGRERVRVSWEGARGRGRDRMFVWDGALTVHGARVTHAARFGEFHPERPFRWSEGGASWQSVTTGNRVGVDLWLDRDDHGVVRIVAGGVDASFDLATLGDEQVVAAGGLGLCVRVVRLGVGPSDAERTVRVPLASEGDTPIRAEVWFDDGHRAWTSPIYAIRG
jgi:hypothetical protein